MKHPAWSTHMLMAGACALLGVGFSYKIFFLSPTKVAVCDRYESQVGKNGQKSVIIVDGECGGMASSSSSSLSVKDSRGRISSPFLVYYRDGPGPVVNWVGSNTLLVDVLDPGTIKYARGEMEGLRIRYRLRWRYNDHSAS